MPSYGMGKIGSSFISRLSQFIAIGALLARLVAPSGTSLAGAPAAPGGYDPPEASAGVLPITDTARASLPQEPPLPDPTAPAQLSAVPGDEYWAEGFTTNGPSGRPMALAVDGDGVVYAGGWFAAAGDAVANHVAHWDALTESWQPLGTGVNDWVEALAAAPDGTLYAGGRFTTAGGVPANYIAQWDGADWQPVGDGLADPVTALAVDASGTLYALTRYYSDGAYQFQVLKWNPATEAWEDLAGPTPGKGNALATDGSGNLYVGGWFSAIGGVSAANVAMWDGSAWHALGLGLDGPVYTLTVAGGTVLFAGGSFLRSGSVILNRVARWDAAAGAWRQLGSGVSGGGSLQPDVYALAADSSGNLYVGGEFTSPYSYIARWDGAWHCVGNAATGGVWELAMQGSMLYAAGNFSLAGCPSHIASWDGAQWGALGDDPNVPDYSARALAADGAAVYAGGDFRYAGCLPARNIASWDGSGWHPLGSGLGVVYDLTIDGDGNLYAAAYYAGGAYEVARWDGAEWTSLGAKMDGYISALTIDGGGTLYAGGEFEYIGFDEVRFVARWNGTSWEALGDGPPFEVDDLVADAEGNVYASDGYGTGNLYRWDAATTTWGAIGGSIDGDVDLLAIDADGRLYAAGHFTPTGSLSGCNIARWDGDAWDVVLTGLDGRIEAMVSDSVGNLCVGGRFSNIGGVSANNIARWNASTREWQPLGSGTNCNVYALALDGQGSLYASGCFEVAGGKASIGFGRYALAGLNRAPNAADDAASTPEDTPVTIAVLDNDHDPDGDALTVDGVGSPAHGVAAAGDTDVTYTPSQDYWASDTFTYTVRDTLGLTDTATVTVSVTPVNDAPVAADDVATTAEDTPVTISVLANDEDPDGDALTLTGLNSPAHGGASIVGATVAYTPTLNYWGDDTFAYTVRDSTGLTDTAAVTVTVTPVNDPPAAVDDTATTPEDTPLTISVLANDEDPDGDTLSVAGVSSPAHGGASIVGATVAYTPTLNYWGDDTFAYTVRDSTGLTDTAAVTVTVTPVNDAPVAVDDIATTAEDTPVTISVLANDEDPDGDALTLTELGSPAHGGASIVGATVAYTPTLNYWGDDTFTYMVRDSLGLTGTATVTVTVTPVNNPPVAVDDTAATAEDTPVTISVLANDEDPDGDTLSLLGVNSPSHGDASIVGATVAYTPTLNYWGSDTFTYTVRDTLGLTDTATVTVTVTPVNDPPAISGIPDQVTLVNVPIGPISFTIGDVDTPLDDLTLSAETTNLSLVPQGSIVFGGTGYERTVTITPAAGATGVAIITIHVSDGEGTATTSFELRVTSYRTMLPLVLRSYTP